jgi:hypothetical protein
MNYGVNLAIQLQSGQNLEAVYGWQINGQQTQLWGFVPASVLEAFRR